MNNPFKIVLFYKISALFIIVSIYKTSFGQCNADAGNNSTMCAGVPTQLDGSLSTVSNGTIDYSWSPATNLSATNIANPICTATSTTTYTLTITNGVCSDTAQITVMVNPNPTANFTFTQNNQCANFPVVFSNTSTGINLTYSWNFNNPSSGSNNISTQPNPKHEFVTVGNGNQTFSVILIATNNNGCSDSVTQNVTVNQTPGPSLIDPISSFKQCDGSGNFNLNVFNTTTSPAVSNYIIQWGDGTPNFSSAAFPSGGVQHTYTTQDIFSLLFIVSGLNGCIDTAITTVGNITNPGIGAANPGGTAGCGPSTLCFPLSNFSTNHISTYYVVNYGDGTPYDTLNHPPPSVLCHTYSESSCGGPGNSFTFRMKAINLCDSSESTISPIRVYTGPIASFNVNPVPGCVGSPITMVNTSTLGFNSSCQTTTIFNWNFGDGTTLTQFALSNPTHIYAAPGTYTVNLTTHNACDTTTDTKVVCIESAPVPLFTITPQTTCVPFNATTVNQSTIANTCNVTYNWTVLFNGSTCLPSTGIFNFIGGTNASSFQPQFQFVDPGTYTVRLTYTNSCGSFNYDQLITAQAPPQISINSLPDICEGQSVSPTASIIDCNDTPTIFNWTFSGSGAPNSNQQTPGAVTYNNDGNFTITFSATNTCGTVNTNTPLVVNEAPVNTNPTVNSPICVGGTAQFDASLVAGATYSWTGPNGFTSAIQNPSIANVSAAATGTYTVVANINGCPSPPSTVDLVIIIPPVVTITPAIVSICENESVTLTASGATSYNWSPVTNLNITNQAVVIASPSTTTTYTVTGFGGSCSADATVTVTVNPSPIVGAGNDLILCTQSITETLIGTPAGGTWTGGGILPNGDFTPSTTGTFVATYTFEDLNSCESSDNVNITVVAPVAVTVDPDFDICQNLPSVNLLGNPNGGAWAGTNVTSAGVFSPTTVGTFTLTYSLGIGSCQTTDDIDITVDPLPIVNAGNNQTVCIDNGIINLFGTPAGGTWSGTSVTAGGAFNPLTSGVGTFNLTYTFVDPTTTCENQDVVTIIVNALPVVNAGSDFTVCNQPIPVNLTGTPAGGTWSGTGITDPTGQFTPSGTGQFTVTYTFTDANGCTNQNDVEITVIDPVQANAGLDQEICINEPNVQLNGTPALGTWSGTNVTVGGLFSPITSGTFTLTYSFGAGNCLTTDAMDFVVNALPIVNAGADEDFCLTDAAVNFVGAPLGGVWSGTGITNAASGTFNPTTAGVAIHIITYTYTDANSCVNSDVIEADVHPLPTVSFTNNPIACIGAAENYTNTTLLGSTFTWNFGDGGTASIENPSHTYSTIGFYDIDLVATTVFGCIDSVSVTIEVREPPVAFFTLAPDSGCAPFIVNFIDNSSGVAISYNWDFGNGQSNATNNPPSITYNQGIIADTTYYIQLDVTNFCGTVSQIDSVIVTPSPTAIFGPQFDIGCSPWVLEFANNSLGIPDSYFWDFGDGTTSTTGDSLFTNTFTTGTNPTDYTIMLAVANECGVDTSYHTITVLPNTVNAFFNTDVTTGCVPLTVNFTQFSTGAPFYSWNFGDGNTSTNQSPTHTFTTPGTYTVALFINDGCSYDTSYATITVNPSPLVDFTSSPSTVCINQPFSFTNLSQGLASSTWDFGDGGSSLLTNPSYSYSVSGTYQVTLTGIGLTNGCIATITHPVTVSVNPTAGFTATTIAGCMPLPVSFTNTSTNYSFQSWNFGDGNTSGANNPNHTFSNAGSYTVKLVLENNNGCRDSISQVIMVYPLPNATFTISNTDACYAPVNITTFNNSTGAINYEWNFGNGFTSTLTNITTNYANTGTYTIQLIATSIHGCKDTATMPFTVYPTPEAAFILPDDTACVGQVLTYISQSNFADSIVWIFGDGTTGLGDVVTHAYTAVGSYTVTIMAYGAGGCGDTLSINTGIQVFPTPTAGFVWFNLQNPDPLSGTVEFTNTSSGAISYEWQFGNGQSSDEENPTHRFRQIGSFYTTLYATNEYGCTDSLTKEIIIEYFKGLYVPNAMYIGHNSFEVANFIPKGVGLKIYQIWVYDTWGNLMWYSDKIDADGRPTEYWDGTFEGKILPQDAYVWKVKALFTDDTSWQGKEYPNGIYRASGTLTIIR